MTFPGIEAIAYALPAGVVTNADLQRENPDWDMQRMFARTGVESRHIAAPGETALDSALEACRRLDECGALRANEIDALIFCTETPDYPIPPNSCVLHGELGLRTDVIALDITLGCSGYVYALGLARSLVQSSVAKRVLIATADTYSRLINPQDRSSRVLFGDGGAACIFAADAGKLKIDDMNFMTSGAEYKRFIVSAGGFRNPKSEETGVARRDRSGNIRTAEQIHMDGMGVLAFFNSAVPKAVRALLDRNGLSLDDISLIIPHQASAVAIEGVRRGLGIQDGRIFIDFADTGNLVSASIPTAMARAWSKGALVPGQRVLLCGFGVGLSWANALLTI